MDEERVRPLRDGRSRDTAREDTLRDERYMTAG
jgi:hypothetical protein